MRNDADLIGLEIVFGNADRQSLIELSVRRGVTCAEAIDESGVASQFPDDDLKSLPIAIWGNVVSGDWRPDAGDRIEILRPLVSDPREARRQLAQSGQFMGGTDSAVTDD